MSVAPWKDRISAGNLCRFSALDIVLEVPEYTQICDHSVSDQVDLSQ